MKQQKQKSPLQPAKSKALDVIGMIHLKALPGSPRYGGSLAEVEDFALSDAEILVQQGIKSLMVENFYDAPFTANQVASCVVASMTRIATKLREMVPEKLGINVLRNDGLSALSIALACDADMIRVNVLSGARVTDQGVIQSIAYDLMRKRKVLDAAHIAVFADVDVKHSAALAPRDLKDEVEDTVKRGLADAVIVSGAGTGKAVDQKKVEVVLSHAGNAPVYIGSGVDVSNVKRLPQGVTGVIVGSSLKKNGVLENPVDKARTEAFMSAIAKSRG